ncbi:hypothetical protein BR93DRAFT_392112 [Coniochaeta sp. PMI_546]|nr:hypothetical protein BR93DRAFT_392112 [Coniochaeta sp. PMI_546]
MVDLFPPQAASDQTRSSQPRDDESFQGKSDLFSSFRLLQDRVKRFAISARKSSPLATQEDNRLDVPILPKKQIPGRIDYRIELTSTERPPMKLVSTSQNGAAVNSNDSHPSVPGKGAVEILSSSPCAAETCGNGTVASAQVPPLSAAFTNSLGNSFSLDSNICATRATSASPGHNSDILQVSQSASPILASDPFRDPIRIPCCSPTTFVYPHSRSIIEETYGERFQEVVNIFRRNINDHPRLRDFLHYIDYTLKLCGPSITDSHPSILVFCRNSEFKNGLRTLLTSKELKYQYSLRRQDSKYTWLGTQASSAEDCHRPLFNLYFWRQRRPRTLYWGQAPVRMYPLPNTSPIHRHIPTGLTMCGSSVELLGSRPKLSTIGCILRIDSEFYAVTSMHTFTSSSDIEEGPVNLHGANNDSPTPDTDTLDLVDEDYLVDEIEYDSYDEDSEEELATGDVRPNIMGESFEQRETTVFLKKEESMLALFPTFEALDAVNKDYDWALIRLTDKMHWRPNAFVSPALLRPTFLFRVAELQPMQETRVLVITGRILPLEGVLQPGTSVLGGCSGKTPSTMWTLILDERDGLVKGDSGSLVVDARTHAIYGHVVGSNPIGEVYVSPYSAVIDQIRTQFQASTVTIPDPITTLSSLIQSYATSIPGSIRDQVDSRSLAELEDFCSNTIHTPDRVERLLSLFVSLVELPLDSYQLQSANKMADTPDDTA